MKNSHQNSKALNTIKNFRTIFTALVNLCVFGPLWLALNANFVKVYLAILQELNNLDSNDF
jgi:hypothetical protein